MSDLRTAVQQALEHVQEFKRRWMAVPPFGNKVNKATREAVSLAHMPVFQIEEALRAALEQPVDDEYEVRADGMRVRKDRWQVGIRRIVALLWGNRKEFEIDEVVEAVRALVPQPFSDGDDEALVRAVLEQPERDWEDLYRKEKARADMWRDKYESLAGPDERVYPQQEQEPIAFVPVHPRNGSLWSMTTNEPSQERLPSYPLMPLYTHPPSREWQGLTDKDLGKLHGALEEREACAKVCEENAVMIGVLCAAAIRARGQA